MSNAPRIVVLAGSVLAVVALAAAPACGGDKKAARATCERAGDRYQQCVLELLGPEAAALAAQKKDIDSCVGDDMTVRMYDTCLVKTKCDEFMDCMMDYAAKTAP
ncbi:MAG: hypothetical protein U1F43_02425 [Myxococcota bacterium]